MADKTKKLGFQSIRSGLLAAAGVFSLPLSAYAAGLSCQAPLIPTTVCASSAVTLPTETPPTPTPTPTGAQATSANQFLSSLGVVPHVAQGYNPASYVAPLKYLGVTAVRDYITPNLITLYQQAGVKLSVMLPTTLTSATLTSSIASIKSLAQAGALLAIEGANEPNNFPISYNGTTGGGMGSWAAVANAQRDIYAAVKADSVLRNYPVIGVSETGAEVDNVGLQYAKIPAGSTTSFSAGTAYYDYANVHNYVIGNGNQYGDNQAWSAADPTLNQRWDGLYGNQGVTWRNHFAGYSTAQLQTLPRVTTETGWDTVSNPGGERVQGVVLVNTYLAQWARGWRYTFIYELGDGEGGGGNQGLFHTDWTPKLSANYIHNLTTILSDPTPIATPGKLDVSILNPPATVHSLLFQKSSGVFDLVVWGESVSGSANVTVNFGSPHASVKVYDVTAGSTPTRTLTNASSVTLTMMDHAMIVETQ